MTTAPENEHRSENGLLRIALPPTISPVSVLHAEAGLSRRRRARRPCDGHEAAECEGEGSTQNHFFSDKKVAVSYARSWAEANRPARVRVETREGRTEAEWVYEPFARKR